LRQNKGGCGYIRAGTNFGNNGVKNLKGEKEGRIPVRRSLATGQAWIKVRQNHKKEKGRRDPHQKHRAGSDPGSGGGQTLNIEGRRGEAARGESKKA